MTCRPTGPDRAHRTNKIHRAHRAPTPMDKTPPDALATTEPEPASPPRPRGRPTSLTDEVRTTIIRALKMGTHREVAARLAGIDPRTLTRWMNTEGEPWESFQLEVEQAEAETEMMAVGLVLAKAESNPQLAVSWLERRHKDRWSTRQETTGKDGGPVQMLHAEVDVSKMTDAELRDLARPAEDAGSEGQGGAGTPTT